MPGPNEGAVVFVVDDDASMRRRITALLRASGWAAEAFASASEFLEREQVDGAHCLILAVDLPDASGLELQERMLDEYPWTPIIFISGDDDIPSSVRAMKGGALEFLTKPPEPRALLSAVELAMDTSRIWHGLEAERRELRARYDLLKPREREVMNHVVAGMRNRIIADKMGITESTVKLHRGRVMAKMRADSLPALVRISRRLSSDGHATRFGRRRFNER